MRIVNANHLLLDYCWACERFGPLDFEDFAEMWMDADAIARSTIDTEGNDDAKGKGIRSDR